MHISNIPSEVIEVILHKAVALEEPVLSKWKYMLPLIAVNHNWRHLAIPAVYSCVHVTDSREGKLISNIQLAINAHASSHVKHIAAKLEFCFKSREFFEHLLQIMSTATAGWGNVSSLYLVAKTHSINSTITEDMVPVLSANIKNMLPNITRLRLVGFIGHAFVPLYNCLTSNYALQLKQFTAEMPVHITAPAFSDQLETLEMRLGNDMQPHIPRVQASTLQHLKLCLLPNDYTWTSFIDNGEVSEVHFLQLKSLDVFSSRESEDASLQFLLGNRIQGPKLHFPALNTLRLRNAPDNCAILINGLFSSHLKNVCVYGTVGAFKLLANLKISSLDCLEIELNSNQQDTEEFTQVTNQLFTSINIANSCMLSMANIKGQANFETLNWPNLTALNLERVTPLSTLLQLLPKLPKLRQLNLFWMKIDVPTEIINISELNIAKVTPEAISTSLTHFRFGVPVDAKETTLEVAAIKFLMLRLPQLQMFHAIHIPEAPLLEFIHEYQGRVPHLTNVKVKVKPIIQ